MKSSSELSQRQQEILGYIQDFIHDNGFSPSIRDIQVNLNISSTSVVAYNLKALQDKGKLDREGRISRGIRLADTGTSFQVPMLGTITAGEPLPNPQDTSTSECDLVEVPADMIPAGKVGGIYALKVRGQSMIDALIDDQDVVLIRYQETAENGNMVAVRLLDENAVTLKKFYLEDGQVRLQPANSTMQARYTHPENVRIEGRVVGVLRHLGA